MINADVDTGIKDYLIFVHSKQVNTSLLKVLTNRFQNPLTYLLLKLSGRTNIGHLFLVLINLEAEMKS